MDHQLFSEDLTQRVAHHDGLVKMIELRGGINVLPRVLAHQNSRLVFTCAYNE